MEKENTQVGFKLNGIKTEQFAIIEENYVPKKITDLGTELQFKLNQINKQIAVFLGFEFKQGKKIFLKVFLLIDVSIYLFIEILIEESNIIFISKQIPITKHQFVK
jgi:hypothetical protein